MIKTRINNEYKDIIKIFGGGPLQKEITKVWSREANKYVYESEVEYTGTLPITINADGSALIDYCIYGNTEQNGTPTPEATVDVVGCGVRTENLLPFDDKNFVVTNNNSNITVKCENGNLYIQGNAGEIASSSTEWKNNFTIELEAGTYYCNSPSPLGSGFGRYIKKYDNDSNILGSDNYTFTITENTKCYLGFYIYNKSVDSKIELMLNVGSTALPYEPYGYKLPILSNSTVTNIYLGEVETTRRIKKLVLTGEEDWVKRTSSNQKHTFEHSQIFRIIVGRCSHYANYTAAYIDMVDGVYLSNTFRIIITDLRFTAVTDFMDYLAAQYAAGTPVTIWFAIAEPETGIVNEPLMKIGNYADTVSMEQAGVSIPTIAGTTVIDCDGELKPSQMYIKYRR